MNQVNSVNFTGFHPIDGTKKTVKHAANAATATLGLATVGTLAVLGANECIGACKANKPTNMKFAYKVLQNVEKAVDISATKFGEAITPALRKTYEYLTGNSSNFLKNVNKGYLGIAVASGVAMLGIIAKAAYNAGKINAGK